MNENETKNAQAGKNPGQPVAVTQVHKEGRNQTGFGNSDDQRNYLVEHPKVKKGYEDGQPQQNDQTNKNSQVGSDRNQVWVVFRHNGHSSYKIAHRPGGLGGVPPSSPIFIYRW